MSLAAPLFDSSLVLAGVTVACAVVALATTALWLRAARLRRRAQPCGDVAAEVPDEQPVTSSGLRSMLSRDGFEELLDAATTRCDRESGRLALLFVDIDDFASVNAALGHALGDRVLRKLAARVLRAAGSVLGTARLGGDEFMLLLAGDLEQSRELAQRLLAAVQQPLEVGARRIELAASIGIAVYPEHGARRHLSAHAAAAMRQAKSAGGNGFAVFDARTAADARASAALLAELRHAIARRQLELVYQPKVEAETLQVTGAEALLRWQHPVHGLVSPAIFVPLAEAHGLIDCIGEWVIDEACRQAGLWRAAGLRMRVAINLSPRQMRQDNLVARLTTALASHRLQPGRFTVEVTESLALQETTAVRRTFEGLRAAGVHVAIDDFGAGHTSLAHLRRLPVSELKMDASLVRDLADSEDARAIASAVIRLAHALELRVVAEGVETQAQREWLAAAGCDELQGFLFAKPMTGTALGLWARTEDEPGGNAGFRPSLFQETRPAPIEWTS